MIKMLDMFNNRSKQETTLGVVGSPSASIIAPGATLKGDINSTGDLRIDGHHYGNINCTAKVIIGANGLVEGDISSKNADILGKVKGTVRVKELLQIKGNGHLDGNIHVGKLQIEASAQFNGQCHMVTDTSSQESSQDLGSRIVGSKLLKPTLSI